MIIGEKKAYAAMSIWLFVCCCCVFIMIVLGGATRLTGSGLSMVEWKPITGFLPPLNVHDWQILFEKYKQYPEFQLVNADMSLQGFKQIFWLEFIHRNMGRFIGIVYLFPFLYFIIFRSIGLSEILKLSFIFLLGALQGFMGWFMVQSGLNDNPHVSHYRLAAHLMLALVIFTCMYWLYLRYKDKSGKFSTFAHHSRVFSPKNEFINRLILLLFTLVFIMVLSGAFVAGTKAGHIYNTFPKMNGDWFPNQALNIKPFWLNFIDNPIMLQFIHRFVALLTVLLTILLCVNVFYSKKSLKVKFALLKVLFFMGLQVSLGILTLIYSVPLLLGVLHQANAVLFIASIIYFYHRYRY